MSKLDDKFNKAIGEAESCFVVAQAMAKNSFKIGLERDDLLAACEYNQKLLTENIGQTTHAIALNEAAIAQCK